MPGTHPHFFQDEVDQALHLRGELTFFIVGEEGNLFLELLIAFVTHRPLI